MLGLCPHEATYQLQLSKGGPIQMASYSLVHHPHVACSHICINCLAPLAI